MLCGNRIYIALKYDRPGCSFPPKSVSIVTNVKPCFDNALRTHGIASTDVGWISWNKIIAPARALLTAREHTILLSRSAQSRVSTDHRTDDMPNVCNCCETEALIAPYSGRIIAGVCLVAA